MACTVCQTSVKRSNKPAIQNLLYIQMVFKYFILFHCLLFAGLSRRIFVMVFVKTLWIMGCFQPYGIKSRTLRRYPGRFGRVISAMFCRFGLVRWVSHISGLFNDCIGQKAKFTIKEQLSVCALITS